MSAGILMLGLAVVAGAAQTARAQTAGAQKNAPAAEAETLTVEIVSQPPREDRENLKGYWTGVESRTKERWMRALPALAKPPLSTPGVVKIDCWIHTDGRVTGMTLEQPSGQVALDRAAWAGITGSAPYDAYPYGIAVEQVKVRFTFSYNQSAASNQGAGAKRRN